MFLLASFGVWRQVRFLIALQYQPVALKQVENKTKKKKCSPVGFEVPQLEVIEYVSPFKETNAFYLFIYFLTNAF